MPAVVDEVKLSLRVMINKENNKVLFAEADSDFADVLSSFLTLPLGKIVRLMKNHYGKETPVIGSLTYLYNCLSEMGGSHFWTEGGREMLLDPGSSFSDECRKLKINVDDTMPATKYFRCGNPHCCRRRRSPFVTMYHDKLKCDCGEYLNKPMGITGPENEDDCGVFMKKGLSFLITDDLKMVPVEHDSFIQTLLNLGVAIPDGAQLRIVSLGLNEIMDLLRASLLSSTPLTDVIFHRKSYNMDGVTGESLRRTINGWHSKKMIVKAWVNKSSNHIGMLVAETDFVDFLVSFLTIPLGGVVWLLDGNTGFRSIDNLHRSIRLSIDEKCFRLSEMKLGLVRPDLPPSCLSKSQIFSLEEEVNPKLCYFESVSTGDSNTTKEISSWMHFKDPKGGECYVKSSGAFLISYNLTVRSEFDYFTNVRKVHPNFKEMELHIGVEEALNLLKASLTSGSPLREFLETPKPAQ